MDFWSGVVETGVRLMVPILLAALGEVIAQRAGVMNIGMEGYMAAGGYAGFVTMLATDQVVLAVLAAVAAGTAASMLMVFASVWGRANQILAGFAIFIMVPSLTGYLYVQLSGAERATKPLDSIGIPLLQDMPVIGRALFDQNVFWYLSVALVGLVWVLLERTRWGLEAGAVGQDPDIGESKGVGVRRVRTQAVMASGALGGLGGAALTVGALGAFSSGVVNGRGFIAIAVVILGGWKVGRVLVAAAVVGMFDALQLRAGGSVAIPTQLLAALPWVVVLLLLIVAARFSSGVPRALGRVREAEA
jgi:ABC-type uncharacterized transport system permease subunit